jgi:3-phenylpropionate/trans-cinnamate dioxygenase ferredoxin reductase subunit
VLATGSEPVRPPVTGGDDPEIRTMRTVENSTHFQDRVGDGDRAVVVGSGFIGCEPVASLALRSAAVTLASHEQSPQGKGLGDEVGERTEGWLRDFGVDLRLGVRIEGVERTDGGLTVNLDDGIPSIREPSSSRPVLGPASGRRGGRSRGGLRDRYRLLHADE